MIDTAKATIDGFSDFVISATDSTVTLSNIYNPESHPATKIYFVRIREGNAVIKVIDENGNTDNLEQLVRGTLYYDYEASEITLNIRKGFSEFNSTMTILDDVELFELSFYEGDWKTAEEVVDFSGITAIQATLAVNIPVSKSIEKRCLQDNSDMIKLTKNRIFWLPPDENLN